jgi:hypothetical protein
VSWPPRALMTGGFAADSGRAIIYSKLGAA